MLADDRLETAEWLPEVRRVLQICNVCGYCNGFCDVFDAARRRPALHDADLAHLANLCHGCRNCLYACQYAPPHALAVNLPRTLTAMRQHVYRRGIWPTALAGVFQHSGLSTVIVIFAAIACVLGLALLNVPAAMLVRPQQGLGAFYRILPWDTMVLLGALPLAWSSLAIGIGLRRYWRVTRPDSSPVTLAVLGAALYDILILRNLRGGGAGCNDFDHRLSHQRRRLHQTLLTGLLLSFAATLAATIYHHALGWEAPYPVLSLPVLTGTLGGISMAVASAGLLWLTWREDRIPTTRAARQFDHASLLLLSVVAVSGLSLLVWRDTAAMGLLLVVHLGGVLALFLLLPYSKPIHAGYRAIALVIEALEQSRQA